MRPKKLLIIFAKNAVQGSVKTRLARDAGEERALKIYKGLLRYTHRITCKIGAERQIWYSSWVPDNPIFPPYTYTPLIQQGEDLGDRMLHAFRKAFRDGYRRVVIIGTDCAFLTEAIIEQAFEELKNVQVVLGPSEDGGYYLLGMKRLYPYLFKQKNWSTSEVYRQTRSDLETHGISWKALPLLNDVDTWDDWKQAEQRLKKHVKNNH